VAGENIVRILVTSDNDTQPGFDETAAGADEMAAKISAAYDEFTAAADRAAEAQEELATASARLDEVQADGGASVEELTVAQNEYAAALDRSSAAATASMDAQLRLGEADQQAAVAAKESGDAALDAGAKTDESAASSDAAGASAVGLGSKMKLAALGMVAGAAVSVKMAADWQESLTQLVTGAGEPVKAMGMIRQAILGMSVGTDTSVQDLTSGLYMISSAGFHGAAGLKILQAAAEGAKTGNASLADVSNVLTSAMNAYHLPASQAVAVTNELVATVASGKMHMQDLATSLSSVLPIAASAHISFAQVGGALATMTMQGMTARRASMGLANMIRSLLNPSATASSEMKDLGLSANDVASRLGQRGLTGTLSVLTEAILKNSKGGSVLASSFKQMSPAAQALSEKIIQGKISTNDLTTALKGLNPEQAALVTSFEKSAVGATGLKQTFDAAMAKMVGGATGLNVALLLGGKNAAAFRGNVKSVGDAAAGAGKNVHGWSDIQSDFNFKLGQAGKAAEAVAYNLGDALLPAATKLMAIFADLGGWFARNAAAGVALAAVIGGTLAMVIGGKLITSLQEAREAFTSLADSEMLQSIASKAAAAGQWLLDAAMDANPIMLVVIAIAAIVAAIVLLTMHSKAFRDFWKDCWKVITDAAVAAWHFIDDDMIHPLMAGIDDLVNFIRTHWQILAVILATVLLGPVAGLIAFIATHWQEFRSLTSRLVDDVVRFFEELPGRIMGAIAALPGELFSFGGHAISMLASGLLSAVGDVIHAMTSIGGEILAHIPHSPAKKGPLSGSGSPDLAGRKIAQMLGQGMLSGLPDVSSAANRMAGAAGIGPGGVMRGSGAGGGGGVTLEITGGGSGLDELFITWLKQKVRVKGGGGPFSVQKALGSTWPPGA
jgi:TP901 family phage tail tape measure protein